MVETEFLLNLLQFVAVLAPALAILMQVVLKFEDDRQLMIGSFTIDELRILQLSLAFVLIGGAIIGGILISDIDNPLVAIGMALIFGGLPFSAIAIFIMANKSNSESDDGTASLTENIRENFNNALSIMLVAGVPAVVYFGILDFTKPWVNTLFNFGFLYDGIITPSTFLGAGFVIMIVKSLLTVFDYEIGDLNRAFNLGVRNSLYLPLMLVVFIAIPYGCGYFATSSTMWILPISKSNPLLNIAHFWSGTLYYVIFAHNYDPLQEH